MLLRRIVFTAALLLSFSAPVHADPSPDSLARVALVAYERDDIRGLTRTLGDLSEVVSEETGVAAAELRRAWLATDDQHLVALLSAISQLGTPYRYNGETPGVAFDCSGLTSWAWGQADVAIPSQSGSQRWLGATDDPQAGDIAWYPGHVAIWLGVGSLVVHAPRSGDVVKFSAPDRSQVFIDPSTM